MNTPRTTLIHSPGIKHALFFIAAVALFVIAIILISPLSRVFEYNTDEGINLMKSWLLMKGFFLYKQIWSDQPPLMTLILSYWLKLFGLSVYHARILILIFSAMLLWAFYQTIKMLLGRILAFIALIFLVLSTAYLRLSASVMIGIPALALAMFSIYFITVYKKIMSRYALIISAVFMALSLQAKLFTAFLVPVILFEIIQTESADQQRKKIFFPVFIWLTVFSITWLSISAVFFGSNLNMMIQQLFQPHLVKSAFNQPYYSFSVIRDMMFRDYDIILLALVGTILLVRRKEWEFLLPVLWLVAAFFVLINHKPVWDHHYLLISIPCCWMAAFGLRSFLINSGRGPSKSRTIDRILSWSTACLLISAVLILPVKLDRAYRSLSIETASGDNALVRRISKYAKDSRWIVTDRPIVAFYAHIPVPPELAVISEKRFLTKNLTVEYFISVLDRYKPGQVLLARFKEYDPKIISYIEERYSRVFNDGIKLYLLKGL